MTIKEGENNPQQLSPKEFIRALRELYARAPHHELTPAVDLTPEQIDEQDDALQRRIEGEYGERLHAKTQELLDVAPYLSSPLRIFIERELGTAFALGVLDKTENQPLPESYSYKGLYEVLTEKLPLVEELESDEETIKQLEIVCYNVELTQHTANKEKFEERFKKRIPSLPEYFIRIYGEGIDKREKNLRQWRSFIFEKFETDPEQPIQPPEQNPLT